MSHPVSALAFRSGKTIPWAHSTNFDQQSSDINLLLSQFFLLKNKYVVKTSSNQTAHGLTVKILYYPLFSNFNSTNSSSYLKLRALSTSSARFNPRLFDLFLNQRKAKNLKRHASVKAQLLAQFSHRLSRLDQKRLSMMLTRRTGVKFKVRTSNVLHYLRLKRSIDPNALSRLHFDRSFNRSMKSYKYYHDIINSLVVSSRIQGAEPLVLFLTQQSLHKIHYYRVKPKKFFYFLDKALKSIKDIQRQFESYRIAITGKLRGGTARTANFIVGYGPLAKQTLYTNSSLTFGTIKSTYGSFGVKLLTSRNPSNHAQT